jgi:hypothetical protein
MQNNSKTVGKTAANCSKTSSKITAKLQQNRGKTSCKTAAHCSKTSAKLHLFLPGL